jgi:hypothetical protein
VSSLTALTKLNLAYCDNGVSKHHPLMNDGHLHCVRRARSTMPLESLCCWEGASRVRTDAHVLSRTWVGVSCAEHPSPRETRRTNPSRNGRFATVWGWLVRARSSSTAAPVGDTHARAGSMDRTFAAQPTPSRGATGWAVRPATRPSVQRAAELVCCPLGRREGIDTWACAPGEGQI